jgi:hypothetical protein
MSSAAPLDIRIAGEFEPTTRSGHADITIIATNTISYSNLRVRIAIVESNITWMAPNGTLRHHQTFRDLVPTAQGAPITIAMGDTINLTQNFSCPSPLVLNNCEIVVYVQSDNSPKRILQGAKTSVMSLSYFLDPFALISPANQDSIETCYPTCVWEASSDPDSGFPVNYLVQLSKTPSFDNPIIVSDTLSDTSWASPYCLVEDSTYYWRVLAINGHAEPRASDDVFSFTIDEFAPYFLDSFSLISPAENDTVETCYPTCNWHPSLDPDSGYAVSYQVYLSVSPEFDPAIISDPLSDTTWSSPYCLPETTWHWKVIASNGHAPDRTSDQVISFIIDEPPTGCVYVAGDINGNGAANGIDIGYGVNYFKGAAVPPVQCDMCPQTPPFYAAGDVNGNCAFNGIDISLYVNYLKGIQPELLYCPTCPPAFR